MIKQYCSVINSPIGKVYIFTDDYFVQKITFKGLNTDELTENELSKSAAKELKAYFEGKIQSFGFPIKQEGSDFQQKVWQALLSIPYGSTLSYAKFSDQLNNPLAIRAIGAANGKNNLAIVVPCHRVIGSDGKLVGYAGELWRKKWLLEHEREIAQKGQMTLKF